MIELLSPAGSPEAVIAAVQNGADAIYMGLGNFNARRGAKNFTDEEFERSMRYCRIRGCKVYVTLNTLVNDREITQAVESARLASELGADGIIIQDLGLAYAIRQALPDIPLHASTQMSIHNLAGVEAAAEMGMTRAVLARELSLEQIKFITQHASIETEVFVHGALCFCQSGQCYMSALIGRRSGNRGMCAQPCRMQYSLGGRMDDYPMSLKDNCLVDRLRELEDAGVACLKIEGRMKRPEYTAIVTKIYSKALKEQRQPSAPDDTQGSFGQILRNHRYVFTIRSVAGPGWPSADEAASNRSAQINLDIQSWDESTTDMYFDTDHHFGVSTREVVLGSKQNAALTVQVDTDLSDYTFQWSDEQGNVSGTAAQSLTGSYFKVEKTNNGRHIVVTALQSNNSDSDERKAYFVINASRWRILMTIRQQIVDISGRTINMVSFRSYLGHLGENLLLPNISPESRGAGLQGILNNPANFGTGGTVICGGFNLLLTNVSASSINDAALALADVIYFNYVSNGDLRIDLSPVGRWLKASAKRVLILSFDSQGVNTPIMQEFLGSTPDLMQTSPKSGSYPLAGKSASDFFTDMGPFTVTPYTPVDANFKFQNYDVTHGEIGPGSAEGITPLLNGPGGGIVLGVDMSRRIIYIGDIDIFSANNSNSGINNSKGTINSNASKLIANLFAWVVGVVQ